MRRAQNSKYGLVVAVNGRGPGGVTRVQGDPEASDGESQLLERIRDALEDRLEALPAFALWR